MFKMPKAMKYRDENKGDGSDAGGGSGGSKVDLNNPEIQAAIQAKIDEEVKGLKNKNSEVIGKLKEAQEKMKQFDGLDVERLKNLQKQFEQNEEMQLLAEGKTEEVVNRRVELLKKDHNQQIEMLKTEISKYTDTLKQKDEHLRKLAVDSSVQHAYMALNFDPAALDDVIRIARDTFIMGEEGEVVPRDAKGNVLYGRDGKSVIGISEWLTVLADKKPYLRGVSKGGGAQGTKSGTRTFGDRSATGKIASGLTRLGM